MKRAYIVVYQDDLYNTVFDAIFGDLLSHKDVFFLIEKEYPQYGIYSYLSSRKLNRVLFGQSSRIYLHYYNLPRLIHKLKKQYVHISVIMHNASLIKPRYPSEIFSLMGKNVSYNLLYLDVHDHVWVCSYANYLFEKGVFDKVFTVDPSDSLKYGIEYCTTPYSCQAPHGDYEKKNQLYFCGSDRGRMATLFNIWKEVKKRKLAFEYDIACREDYIEFYDGDENVHHINHLPYNEVLKRTISSSCILDIVQKGQEALSLRIYEAVVFNKKLLTNNKHIVEFSYYDSRYMQYFESIEDIDWEWVYRDEVVDYSYRDDFSPLKWLAKTV